MKQLIFGLAAASLLTLGNLPQANAGILIGYGGNSTNDPLISGATATAIFEFDATAPPVDGRRLLTVTVENTTDQSAPGLTSAFLTGIAFDTPIFTGREIAFDGGTYTLNTVLGNVLIGNVAFSPFTAGPNPEFDIAFTDGSAIGGGGSPIDGLAIGDSITVSIEFAFDPVFDPLSATPSPDDIEAAFWTGFETDLRSAVRFKAISGISPTGDVINGGSDKITGGDPQVPPDDSTNQVPEPASVAVFGLLALCSAGAGVRRRRLQRK